MRQRQEPVMTAEPAPAVWKNARNPVAPAATSPQAAAPSTAPADVEPEEPAPAVEPAAAVNTRPKGSSFLTRLDQEFRGRAQQNQVNAANEEMVNARVNAWKQASQGLDPNNTRAYQTALKTWAQKNFPSADPEVIDQAAASVTPTGWGSNSQQVQAITDIFNNHITNKQISKPAAPQKTRTGGKVAGQVSQTPNAIRKRAARAGTDSTSAPSAFGNMAAQLAARPTTSSTGGTTKGVAGAGNGVVSHTANPNNPNMQPTTAATTSTPAPQTANPFAGLGQPAGSFTGRQPKKTKAVAPVAESRVDFGAMLWTKMRDSK